MAFYIYNAAPGVVYFNGNEITAHPQRWTEVSERSVHYGTFNTMKRLGFVYVVQSDSMPTYDPSHPDNKDKVEAQAPGSNIKIHNDALDGSMNADQLKALLAKENGTAPVEETTVKTEPEGNTEKLSFSDLDAMSQGDAPAPAAKASKSKGSKAKATEAPAEQTPTDPGAWS